MLNQSLNLRLGQQLKMTPQLQQAIRMLQLSAIELQQEVQEILESNPLLEEGEEETPAQESTETNTPESEASSTTEGEESSTAEPEAENIPEQLETDSNWEDTYDLPSMLGSGGSGEDFESQDIHSSNDSLQDHLIWQLNALHLSERDYSIAITLIDAINPEGYLEGTLEELIESLDLDPVVEMEELTTQLHQIQQFDPAGVGAYDLRECLLIQLHQTNLESAAKAVAINWLENHFKLISEQNRDLLSKKLKTEPR